MLIDVRLNGILATQAGLPRLRLEVAAGATVADLIGQVQRLHPPLAEALTAVVPVVAGTAVSPQWRLEEGQQVALLLPMAGGADH